MRITAAQMLRHYDERTDVREPGEIADSEELANLNALLDAGQVMLVPGLIGWSPYTHTAGVSTETDYQVYHVRIDA